MIIETKYDIGDRLFYIDEYQNRVKIERGTIKRINTGGKVWEEYDFGGQTRAESAIFTTFIDAKKQAIKQQEEKCKLLMEWVNNIEERDVSN